MAIRLLEVKWARCFSCERVGLVPVVKRCSVLCIPSICMHLTVMFQWGGPVPRKRVDRMFHS